MAFVTQVGNNILPMVVFKNVKQERKFQITKNYFCGSFFSFQINWNQLKNPRKICIFEEKINSRKDKNIQELYRQHRNCTIDFSREI